MNVAIILAVASAEMRSIRRLARYWVFSVLAILAAIIVYGQMAFMHGMFSRASATVAAMSPRYLIASTGFYLLIMFLVGLIFLAFDVRARDERERMAEVLASRPVSNTEFLLGRAAGLVCMSWLPVLFVIALLQLFGLLAEWNDWPVGALIEPYSIAGFLVQTLTSLALWCAVIILTAMVIRNRLIVAIVGLGLVGGQLWLTLQLPVFLQPIFTILPGLDIASDLTPRLFGDSPIHYVALWLLSAGLLAAAIVAHARADGGSRQRRLGTSLALIALAGIIMTYEYVEATGNVAERRALLAAHDELRDRSRPDLVALQGTVRIAPGRRLDLDLRLELEDASELVFTFNPGLEVDAITVDDESVEWTHDLGVLAITPGRDLPSEATIAIRAAGVPDYQFGYLDAAFDILTGTLMNSQIGLLGFDTSVFESGYVALMPGSHWLPTPGSAVPDADPRTHPDDFFMVDLEVELPAGWLVAGPGTREKVSGSDANTTFRFRPAAPLPEVALLAAPFARKGVSVAGLELELLYEPSHDRNIAFFEDTADALEERLDELLTGAAKLGLAYPYGALSLVEAPARMRVYGGGWRMDTVQALPGIMLVRENSFPAARFELGLRDADEFADRDGGLAAAKLETIERFFENDFSGGNIFTGATRNFLLFQTGARGEGALAVNFLLDALVSQLLTEKRGYFSAHEFTQQGNVLIGQTITDMATGKTDSVAEAVTRATTNRPSVWDRALGDALADLDPTDNPQQALNALALKSNAIARALLDGFGRERVGHLLAELRTRFNGTTFEWSDVQQLALELDMDIDVLLGDWLHDAALPGFLTSKLDVVRLVDDERGQPRYQTRVHVRNDEPVPGLLRLRYTAGPIDNIVTHHSAPYRMKGNESVELGIVTDSPPYEVWLQPYLSLNRHDIQLLRPNWKSVKSAAAKGQLRALEPVAGKALVGTRPSDWMPVASEDILVDDLDPGFSVEGAGEPVAPGPLATLGVQVEFDQNLPVYHSMFGVPQTWSRAEEETSFGKYRKTHAVVGNGDGGQTAVFSAQLPAAGEWRLHYHIPETVVRGAKGPAAAVYGKGAQGKYTLRLSAGDEVTAIDFDGSAAEGGWNALGSFRLQRGEVRLEVANETSGRSVIADAIRWQRVSEGSQP